MKFHLLLFCFGSLLLLTHADEEKPAGKSSEKPKEDPSTEKPLCSRCNCQNFIKTLDCSRQNLTTWFSDNDWQEVNRSAFEILLLDHNKFVEIKVIPDIGVKKLILSYNNISKIERGAFQNLQDLELLDLSHNNFTSKTLLPYVFEGRYSPKSYEPIPNLKELNLGFNQLHSLDPDLFEHLPALETLILADNIFKTVDQLTETAISSIAMLKNLDMSYLELRTLPEPIFHAPQLLESLNLKGNLFKTIPAALLHTINLKYLNLDENPIEDMVGENVFPKMKSLQNLSLSFLPDIKKIGKGAFCELIALKELNLQRNLQLNEIDVGAFSHKDETTNRFEYPPIEKLNLNHNNLTSLEFALLTRWDKITIDISENNWDCQCENEWLIHDLYTLIRLDDTQLAEKLSCSSPRALKNIKFEKIYKDRNVLRCPDAYGNHPENDGRLLIGMLIGLLVGIPIAMAILVIYKRGCFGLFPSYRNENNRALYKRAEFNDDFHI